MTIMRDIRSSNIARLGYDELTATLIVQFKFGATWTYDEVPAAHYEALLKLDAEGGSVGGYFSAVIRKRYPGTRVPSRAEVEAFNPLLAG
jgi:hypothetical protein